MNIDDADLCVYQKVKLSWGEGGGEEENRPGKWTVK